MPPAPSPKPPAKPVAFSGQSFPPTSEATCFSTTWHGQTQKWVELCGVMIQMIQSQKMIIGVPCCWQKPMPPTQLPRPPANPVKTSGWCVVPPWTTTFCSTTWHDGQGENWVRLCSVYCCNHSKHSREEGNQVHIISSRRTLLLPRPMLPTPTPSPQPHSKPVVASASWSFASPLAVRWLIVVWICSSHDDSGMETWRWWQMIQRWERTKAHQKNFFLFRKKKMSGRGLTCCFVNRHWAAARWRMRKKEEHIHPKL